MRRTAQIERTRLALIHAAASEFAVQGYAAAALQRVSDRIGKTKGSVYFHYPTKVELARSVGEAWTETWTEEVARSTDRGFDLRELESFMVRMTERAHRDPVWEATIRLAREREHISEGMPNPSQEWLTVIRAALHESKVSGEVREDLDVDDVAWQLTAHIIGLHSLMAILPGRPSVARRVRQMRDAHRALFEAT